MSETPAQRAFAASTVALVVAVASLAALLPPLSDGAAVVRTVLIALALASAMLLHWVFLAIGAHRMQRSVAGWLALSVLLFPVGSVAALILLSWFGDEAPQSPAMRA
ncbi:MAG: hypothetical protein ABT20_09525 [Rubrivivax sp. SCN 70-15]|jgi:hypothetical protein|nr:MAG: hypothetical protein ABT20_09525 [Rubrivivax sp. SCN 70-15]